MNVIAAGNQVLVSVKVTNTGDTYSGKEVIQVYVSLPKGKLPKEEKRLTTFAKTKLLAAGESQLLTLPFEISSCSSFDEERTSYILESGFYGVMAGNSSDAEKEILDRMTGEQMAVLVCGTPSGSDKTMIGMSAVTVVGAAGETTSDYIKEPWNLANIVMADGPAGLRLKRNYQIDPNGVPYPLSILEKFIGSTDHEDGTNYYQYCTRIPSGTLLAQTFDLELLEEMGRLVAEEMEEFHVTLWLAPGMNIHRNPLCGRNFEYYSEDPYVTGKMGAAITKGVQSHSGFGTTIKHFACNNQEDNCTHCDSIVSERALREIYLKGFEIAIKESNPLAVMSSYNLVNGVHTANSYDLLTNILRREWTYQGMVMTDWNTTGEGGSSADLCMRAGNDMIMPGSHRDIDEIISGLHDTADDSLQY